MHAAYHRRVSWFMFVEVTASSDILDRDTYFL